MRICWLVTTMWLLVCGPALAQTMTLQTENPRFVVVDRIHWTTGTVFGILDTDTGEIQYKLVPLPPRRIEVRAPTWDPYAGQYREIIGYDGAAFPVYRDEEDYSRVVYWVVERDPAMIVAGQPQRTKTSRRSAITNAPLAR